MKKGLYRPKQQKSFFDNYKALIAAMAFLLLSVGASAQYDSTKLKQDVSTYGFRWKNGEFRYSLILPKDTPHLAVIDSGAMAYKGGSVFKWSGYVWALASGSSGWDTSGNAGTTPGTNFVGTTDNVDIYFKRNSVLSGIIGSSNTSFGFGSSNSFTSGHNNTALGINSLHFATSGSYNTAIGQASLYNNTTGAYNISVGENSLQANTTGTNNTAIGMASMYSNISGDSNIAVGSQAGYYSTTLSKRLYFNSISRGNILGDTTKSIIYGYQDATASNQRLYLNSNLYLPYAASGIGTKALRINPGTGLVTYADTTTSSSTPTLQQVTTAGATTTDTITTTNIKLSSLAPYSLMRNIQNSFGGSDSVVVAAGVIRGDASGGSGSLISWTFLSDATLHSKMYFTGVAGVATGGIRVSYPITQKVVAFIAAPDETLAALGMTMGATVDTGHADIFAYIPTMNGGKITGAGGTTWTKSNKISTWSFDYNSGTGLTRFNAADDVTVTDGDYEAIQLTYTGSNPYLIKRVYSGLSSYNVGFYLTDVLGNPVTGNQSSSDIVTISLKPKTQIANAYQVSGNLFQASIWTANSNIWIIAVFKK